MWRVGTQALRKTVESRICSAQRVSLVPTMGALHDGHASLIRRSRDDGHYTVASVFVNPTQFGPNEDFDKYPRTVDEDVDIAVKAGADLVWCPELQDLYPCQPAAGTGKTRVGVEGTMHVDAGPIGNELCGKSRPQFFAGVCTVVLKLFNLSGAHVAYFGEKDWQQLVIIRQMVREFHLGVDVKGCPIARDPDGLAMSSRNRYLQPEQREHALSLWRTVQRARQAFANGERSREQLLAMLHASWEEEALVSSGALELDYLELRDPETLAQAPVLAPETRLILAAWLGANRVRLIDNAPLVEALDEDR
mmetsp:Transcript_15731/g.42240  ORF Transcript_15731/g.42240 Transcript_15731/m.42240 type:complete len:307 (-) Transcript_15731:571-1491(-)